MKYLTVDMVPSSLSQPILLDPQPQFLAYLHEGIVAAGRYHEGSSRVEEKGG